MQERERRQALADFLRQRRARLTPASVGLPPGIRRRTPGLRREEVAQLANMGTSWYVWLEQVRDVHPSAAVLESLAQALRLTPNERRHLFLLAGQPLPPPSVSLVEESASPALQQVLDDLNPSPAYVLGRRYDYLAWNKAADGLFSISDTISDTLSPYGRNLVWRLFTSPTTRERPNWEAVARATLAEFRAASTRYPGDPWFEDLPERVIFMATASESERQMIVEEVCRFVDREVIPAAHELEHDDIYPLDLIEKLKHLGVFGATIPEAYGGLGLDFATYAQIIEELSRGWMSLSGVVNTHLLVAYMIAAHGSEEQRQRFLPIMVEGDKRGALCLSEASGGSDVQAIRMTAARASDAYILSGSKLWVTNGVNASIFAVLARTDAQARPAHRGMSIFLVEKGTAGLNASRTFDKLGYKGVETAELVFDAVRVPAANLLGGEEGQGFKHAMSGLEVGRINVAARAVGVAQAAFNDAIRYAQQRVTFGKPIAQHQAIQIKLADMATKIEAARLLVQKAARKKDQGERSDLEAGMAKLFASEMCQEVTLEAMRVFGGFGYTKEFNVERYYRDAPLMLVGEGTSEIQRLVIARQLLQKYAIE